MALPLLLEAQGAEACAWLTASREQLHHLLLEHGAILIRGLAAFAAAEFEAVALTLMPHLIPYTRGTGPRTRVGQVYTSTDLPPGFILPLHNELAYSARPPRWLLMFCDIQPGAGGDTPLADVRRIYQRLRHEVRAPLATRGVRYIENLPERPGGRMVGWSQMFGTSERPVVEAICAQLEIEVTWLAGGGLRLINTLPALHRHPASGEELWFNAAHTLHDSWSWEALRAGRRGAFAVARTLELLRLWRAEPEGFPLHAQYGDGKPIPGEHIEHIRDIYWQEAQPVRWRAGDVLFIDNYLVAHGRLPYSPPRRVLTALGSDRCMGPTGVMR